MTRGDSTMFQRHWSSINGLFWDVARPSVFRVGARREYSLWKFNVHSGLNIDDGDSGGGRRKACLVMHRRILVRSNWDARPPKTNLNPTGGDVEISRCYSFTEKPGTSKQDSTRSVSSSSTAGVMTFSKDLTLVDGEISIIVAVKVIFPIYCIGLSRIRMAENQFALSRSVFS